MADPKATSRMFNQIGSFLSRFDGSEIDPFVDLFQPVITDAVKRRRLEEFCLLGMPELPAELRAAISGLPEGFEESDNQKQWRDIFEVDYFGVPEVVHAGYRFTLKQLEQRKDVRLLCDGVLLSPGDSLKAAERCQRQYPGEFVCVACLPESVCSVHSRDSALFIPEFQGVDTWFLQKEQHKYFSRKKIRDYYMLLRKEVIADSHSMTSESQKIWLPKHHPCERFAEPNHLTYGYAVCFKATEGRLRLLSGDVWGRTLVRAAHGNLVHVEE